MLTLWNQFDDLFNDDLFKAHRLGRRGFVPAVDVEETKEGYLLTADVPGMTHEDVDITVENGVLTLKGERKDERTTEEEGYRRVERTFGSFQRAFTLPKGVQTDGISARVDQGQLKVMVPKPVAQLPTKIRVAAANETERKAG